MFSYSDRFNRYTERILRLWAWKIKCNTLVEEIKSGVQLGSDCPGPELHCRKDQFQVSSNEAMHAASP